MPDNLGISLLLHYVERSWTSFFIEKMLEVWGSIGRSEKAKRLHWELEDGAQITYKVKMSSWSSICLFSETLK